jgi:hypothetical protein
LLDVKPTNVGRLLELKRLQPALVDGEGRRWFDPVAGVADYNTATRRKVREAARVLADGTISAHHSDPAPTPHVVEASTDGDEQPPGAESYNEARRRLAIADANKRELEVAERKGALVARESVVRALTAAGTSLKDRLSGLGARLAAGLAAETDPRKTKEAIDDAVREALIALRRDIEKAIPAAKDGAP